MPVFDTDHYDAIGQYAYVQPIPHSPIKQETEYHPWRHLGNFQNNVGSPQPLIDELEKVINTDLKYMSTKRLTPDGALQGYSGKIQPTLTYRTKHGNLSKQEHKRIQTKINTHMKPKLKIPRNIPFELLHGHSIGGGLSFPLLWNETNIEKHILLVTALQEPDLDIYQVMRGAFLRQMQWCCTALPPLQTPWSGLIPLDDIAWLSSLWRWQTEMNITISTPHVPLPPTPFSDDVCIMDAYILHQKNQLDEQDAQALQDYKSGFLDTPTPAIRQIHTWTKELSQLLRKNELFWASDITNSAYNHRAHKSNRRLRGIYNNKINQHCPHKWLGRFLFGVKGLLKTNGECDFSLTDAPIISDTPQSHAE